MTDAIGVSGVGYTAFYKSVHDGTRVTKGKYKGWKFERVEN